MRNLMIGMFCVCFSNLALAGTSAQDPTVASIRSRFAAASTPSLDSLKINQDWRCRQFNANPGNYTSETKGPVTFVQFDGIVQEKENLDQPEASGTFLPKDLTFQPQGLVSVMPYIDAPNDVVGYLAMRVTHGGSLIAEWSILGTSQKGKTAIGTMGLDSSVAFPGASAIAYDVCQLK